MQKLDPKAIWIFFFKFLWSGVFLGFFFGMFIFPFAMGFIFDKNAPLQHLRPKAEIVLSNWFLFLLLYFLLIAVFCYIWAVLSYNLFRYELTEDSFKTERGVIWKKYVSIPYDRIQNVDIHRGIIARILGLSSVFIQTAGFSSAARGPGMWFSEGFLPGVTKKDAERIREDLIKRVKNLRSQGL